MAWRVAYVGKKRMSDFVSNREPHPLPRLRWIELDTQPLLIGDRARVDYVGIRLGRYVQQLGNRKRVEGRAFPPCITRA
jgi:hypothetical protein